MLAAIVGVALNVGTGVFTPTSACEPHTPLAIDLTHTAVLVEWFAFTDRVPESGRANFGASPGDAGHPLPYVYVGPWTPNDDPFWNVGTFARLSDDTVRISADSAAAILAFFAHGYAVATR